jgi:hypothetical protein
VEGVEGKEPKTNSLFTQLATVSNISSLNFTTEGAFLWKQGGSGFIWPESPPSPREVMHLCALCSYAHFRLCCTPEIFLLQNANVNAGFGFFWQRVLWEEVPKILGGGGGCTVV